ncbi:hypothetical protein GCM10009133_00630 [Cocleimonas flava]|uniref:Solute-binding protein family 3/N-terminal domain-containing protein n=1 Tax=Cocleimonas flava TaxID=634765 RepID=A0A4R1F0L9_9GAMM|nr:hypothetical protein [Cocleimonas flava]TCJ85038.1 hypothetical protein EV695_3003 [Cocleimonas flava]
MHKLQQLFIAAIFAISTMASISIASQHVHPSVSQAEPQVQNDSTPVNDSTPDNDSLDSGNKIVISQPDLDSSLFIETARRILKVAYSRIGKEVEFELFPPERSLVFANSGVTGGELVRMTGLQSEYHNLIKIPISIVSNEIYAYTKKQDFVVEGWESLKPYKIDFIFGNKFAEQKSKGFNSARVKTSYQGLRKLSADRSDFFIGVYGVRCIANKFKFNDIKALTPILDNFQMYHYLHKRNESIAEQLKLELLKMQRSGEMESIQKEAKKAFLSQCQ